MRVRFVFLLLGGEDLGEVERVLVPESNSSPSVPVLVVARTMCASATSSMRADGGRLLNEG